MKQQIKKAAGLCLALTTIVAQAEAPRAVPGEFIVKMKSSGFGSLNILRNKGFRVGQTLDSRGDWAVVKAKSIESLRNDPNVQSVEPNYIFSIPAYRASGVEQTWGISKVKAPAAWDKVGQGSANVLVGVVDTGIDYDHPDLADHTLKGYNAITDVMDGKDDQAHGTHVAGTIAGRGQILGVAPGVRLLPSKFLDSGGSGTLADALKAIHYAAEQHVNVMSNSWGGGGFSQSLNDAIAEYCAQGGIFVAAAGNGGNDGVGDNNDRSPSYPASYKLKCVISVAASDPNDKLASFSNYGKTVHIAAPGVDVYSSIPGGKYDTYSGTSMATPHVSGAIALLLSAHPGMNVEEVIAALKKGSDVMKFSTWDKLFGKKLGAGRLNVLNLFN